MDELDSQKNSGSGIIAWMVSNKTAPTILMWFLILGGLLFISEVPKRVMPELAADSISVSILYPGGNPQELEESILLPIEDALRGIAGVKSTMTVATDQYASAYVFLKAGENSSKVFQDVKNSIDRILTFPPQAERPNIQLMRSSELPLLKLVVYGAQNLRTIYGLGERIQDELAANPKVGNVQLANPPLYELSVEVPIRKLREYNLTLGQIASLIQDSSDNLPAGEIYAREGRILLQSTARRNSERDFAEVPVTSTPNGALIKLGDIAKLTDDFSEPKFESRYNGKPAVVLNVYESSNHAPEVTAQATTEYIEKLGSELPFNTKIEVLEDSSKILQKKFDYLQTSALLAFVLVAVVLGLFFEVRVAFWTALSIPIVIFGSFLLLPLLSVSLNSISICAFIVAVVVIIDNSVVIGENIYKNRETTSSYLEASQKGAREVSRPILFGVCINIIGLLPILFLSGDFGQYFTEIPLIVIVILGVSLFYTLFILPSKLGAASHSHYLYDLLNRPKLFVDRYVAKFITHIYIPFVHIILARKNYVIAFATGILMVTATMLYRGSLYFYPLIITPENSITIFAQVPLSTLSEDIAKTTNSIDKATREVIDMYGKEMVTGVLKQINENYITLKLMLVETEKQKMNPLLLSQIIRDKIGNPPGIMSINVGGIGQVSYERPFQVFLTHRSGRQLEMAAKELVQSLHQQYGIHNVDDGFPRGKRQLEFSILPEGRSLGITSGELGRQLRAAFYGSDAIRKQRGRNQVRIVVRLPRSERSSLDTLNNLVLRTPYGRDVFLSQAATYKETSSTSLIQRANGKRQAILKGSIVDFNAISRIQGDLNKKELPELARRYPGLSYSFEPEQTERDNTVRSLITGFLIFLLFIYTVLAILFQSYIQPLVIMAILPFGAVGSFFGHKLFGAYLTVTSVLGVIALTSIVANNALMLVVTANRLQQQSYSPLAAIRLALIHRFRPVLLTSLTTFLAMTPILLDGAVETKSVLPIAISLGIGGLFTTIFLLTLLPALYLVNENLQQKIKVMFKGAS